MTESAYRIHGKNREWEVVIGLKGRPRVISKAKFISIAVACAAQAEQWW